METGKKKSIENENRKNENRKMKMAKNECDQ